MKLFFIFLIAFFPIASFAQEQEPSVEAKKAVCFWVTECIARGFSICINRDAGYFGGNLNMTDKEYVTDTMKAFFVDLYANPCRGQSKYYNIKEKVSACMQYKLESAKREHCSGL